ncbi:hypothetical protein HQ45_06265 [Porphyromonas crevioricanis]|uniref:Mfa1 family fimbria major subunit n=1 Tax=Porphyromonas crevioricanis TaxID=393921 RepID=UPI00052C2CE9|nr:Mfa1 family fimbria major subunit [Porphyromonas crevioricanis]KGN90359.1 hypothetical protein HQ45_06265 [Porphyromonas crevioricanis]
MKVKSLLLAGLATVGLLASCNKNDENSIAKEKNDGTTYANISLMFNADAFRAGEGFDDKTEYNPAGEWKGNDAFERVDVYIVGDAVSSGEYTLADFNQETAGDEVKLTPKRAIKTTPGQKQVYVLVNAPALVREKLATVDKTEFIAAWKDVMTLDKWSAAPAPNAVTMATFAKLADDAKDLIMMSNSKDISLDVEDGVTEQKALEESSNNHVVVPVKRVAARVVTTSSEEQFEIRQKGTNIKLGTIKNITYAAAQGERKSYIQQMIESDVIKTPAFEIGANWDKTWSWTEFVNNGVYTDMEENYDYTDLHKGMRNGQPTPEARKVTKKDGNLDPGKIGAIADPIFIFEASHKKKGQGETTPAAYTGGFRRGNTPYVLVRALFVPEQEYFAEGNTKTNEGEDFYLGTTTNKLYSSKENVTDPTKGGLKGQKYHKYEKGKVLYYAFVNPDVVGKTLDAPAFRNNVYHINITGFKEIGLNWNPLYPEDPNTDDPKNPDPKPKDPNEDPNTPIDPNDPNSPSDTYMSVTVQVLKWNVHSYDIDLGL